MIRSRDSGIRRYEKEHEGFSFGLGKAQFVEEIGQFSGRDELDVQDLMQTESGRALWRVFGFTVPLTYDFASDNGRRTFEQYTLPNSCFSPPETQ